MSEGKSINLLKAAKELNIGLATAVEFLSKKGHRIDPKPGAKLTDEMYSILFKEFQSNKIVKEEAKQIAIGKIRRDDLTAETAEEPSKKDYVAYEPEEVLIKNAGALDISSSEQQKPLRDSTLYKEKASVKVVGKIDLDSLHPKKQYAEKKPIEEPSKAEEIKSIDEKEQLLESSSMVDASLPILDAPPLSEKFVTEKKEDVNVMKESSQDTATPNEEHSEKQQLTNGPGEVIRAKADRLAGPNVIGKIELPVFTSRKRDQPIASSSSHVASSAHKRKRKRKDQMGKDYGTGGGQSNTSQAASLGKASEAGSYGRQSAAKAHRTPLRASGAERSSERNSTEASKAEPSDKEIQDQIKATLARLSGAGKPSKFSQRAKLRRRKRDDVAQYEEEAALERELQAKTLKVTEFVTANELASMLEAPVNQVISTCMSLGLFVSINQRLDAETITIVADEFGYEIEFVKPSDEESTVVEEEDVPKDLLPRAPIITVMGHVDHGKTSLLDFIRKSNVIAGEAGGITQHIGAYEVKLENGQKITFLDTPGHEAFTAMRARGAKVTDIAIVVIAADDNVMPQTREAINHAQAAGVPIVFAFSKIDKPGANTDRIREQLAGMNILVEEWGGKYQSQEISAKTGLNVELLLEKVLLEAELLDLKANPNKRAIGTVIEATLDKGRGIVTTVLIQAGTLKIGDPILAGCYSGRVKALYNERGQKVETAGPSTPIQVLGMQGAPTAGDRFNAMESESEAREIANKRLQLQREQGLRTQKHITLDEIGRRLAIGNFKELKIIVKGDVDGSIEALSDALLRLSTEEVQVNIIHKSVGQISESDVLLASASDAIIIGFQVRPSAGARKLAEQEEIDIRLYSIIYDAINEVKAAMEGMLSPEYEEKITANVDVREVFKISKLGTVAGCMVVEGKITRNSKVRVIREGVVIHSGHLASLKRFKDDAKEVAMGYECGLSIQNFNTIEVGDVIEAYEQVEVKRKL